MAVRSVRLLAGRISAQTVRRLYTGETGRKWVSERWRNFFLNSESKCGINQMKKVVKD